MTIKVCSIYGLGQQIWEVPRKVMQYNSAFYWASNAALTRQESTRIIRVVRTNNHKQAFIKDCLARAVGGRMT